MQAERVRGPGFEFRVHDLGVAVIDVRMRVKGLKFLVFGWGLRFSVEG